MYFYVCHIYVSFDVVICAICDICNLAVKECLHELAKLVNLTGM